MKSLNHSQSHQACPWMLNENRSSLGTAWCTRIHSPVLTWTPVFGSESRAEGLPSCQYNRSSGRPKASDVSDGSQETAGATVGDFKPLLFRWQRDTLQGAAAGAAVRLASFPIAGQVVMTLCFSQEQAAAVHAATKGSIEPVYVSPFVGRLDDQGEDGMDLVRNIKRMYERGDGHVHVLAASIRTVSHLLCSFALGAELATVPTKVLAGC